MGEFAWLVGRFGLYSLVCYHFTLPIPWKRVSHRRRCRFRGVLRNDHLIICRYSGFFALIFSRQIFRRAWLLHRFGGNQKFEQIERGIQRYGVDFLIFTRLIPLFPYNIQNYAYGLTAISFWRYSVVSCLTILPGTFIFTFMASELAENGITLNVTLKLVLCGLLLFVLTQITRRVFSKRFAKK